MYELSEKEKSYLKDIIYSAKNDYFRNNKYILVEETYDEEFENNIPDKSVSSNIETVICNSYDDNLTHKELEYFVTDRKLYKSIEALTLKEKLVLFSFYVEEKPIKEIAKALNLKENSIKVLKKNALNKILIQYIKGKGGKNV